MLRIELTRERKILLITILISWVLLLTAFLIGDSGVIGNVIMISVFLVVTPQFVLNYISFRELKEMELAYPNFLRDLVDSTKAGLPLHKAVMSLSKNNYGPLTKEIRKMANQLSWNIDLIKVLEQSKKRLKRSPLLEKAVRIIIETYKSGGNVSEIFNSLSETLIKLQETEKERQSSLKQYVTAMYVITFVFIGIVVAINKLMVPIFETSLSSPDTVLGGGGGNPCAFCVYGMTIECLPCDIYSNICSMFGINQISISCYYFALFFCMIVIQSISGGLVAGQIGEGSIKAGFKHSLILVSISIAAFMILLKLKVIGV
ncbi:MAG: type II secretion system F family protein [Candidatus Woesearchaeota archaeon]